MSNRDYVKSEIDTLPDSVIEKLREFIIFQKFSLNFTNNDKEALRDIEAASISSTAFWDNPDDEVWNHV